MTENEAIEKLNMLNEALNFQRYDADESSCALQMAIKALEEIQQYRAIGTVEDIQEVMALCKSLQETVCRYMDIGTVEEFKELKEKAKSKKAEWKVDHFTAKFGNPYRCTNCREEYGDTYNYCPNCGCSMKD